MKKHKSLFIFLGKCLLLGLPFLSLVALYIYEDPFMVVRDYNDYDHGHIEQSEGDIGWKKLKRNRLKQGYDAFILGSSCTKAFSTTDWLRHIDGHPFRLFANNEGLGDMCLKLRAIDRLPHQEVRHLLIILERPVLEEAHPQPGIIHIMPPEVTGKGYMRYQSTYLQGFLTPSFLTTYLQYKLTGHCDSVHPGGIELHSPVRTALTNDAVIYQEKEIQAMGTHYWRQPFWQQAMATRPKAHTYPPVIGSDQRLLLKEIHDFCRRHHTQLKVVIGPNYKREALNPKDLAILKDILGDSVVYDFTTYKPFMGEQNFYDPVHYRRSVGRRIMQMIY